MVKLRDEVGQAVEVVTVVGVGVDVGERVVISFELFLALQLKNTVSNERASGTRRNVHG